MNQFCKPEEFVIAAIARLLEGAGHIAVGVLSPIPGSAALLARAKNETRVTILGATQPEFRSNAGVDIFDAAGQGRIDAFFLSGGQIDGQANINLHGIGDYPEMDTRWSGAFGSAYLYFQVPKVILFRDEHSRRTLVDKVDYISAPGVSNEGVYRPGGPYALVTPLCLMMFDRAAARFTLNSIHPGHTLEEIRDNTGFEFDIPDNVQETEIPDAETLSLIRTVVARAIANPYPAFAKEISGI